MKFLSLLFVSVFVSSSSFASLANEALRIDPPYDAFSQCVAQAAVTQVVGKFEATEGDVLLGLVGVGVVGPYNLYPSATLDFAVGSPGQDQTSDQVILMTLTIHSLDASSGWQLIQGSTSEIYPYTTAVDPLATVGFTDQGKTGVLGLVDISGCN
jgi:hypothetical protein